MFQHIAMFFTNDAQGIAALGSGMNTTIFNKLFSELPWHMPRYKTTASTCAVSRIRGRLTYQY